MKNTSTLKQKMAARELTIGSWLSFAYDPLCEMMAKAGFDWLSIDMEHTAIDFAQAERLIRIIDLAGCIPLVRVGNNDPLLIKRSLDAGAGGIIVPMISSVADAEAAVSAAYYPPKGTRGVGLYRAQEYGAGFQKYQNETINQLVVVVQIEHIDAVAQLPEILAVEGVDGFLIGPYDLSASLGCPGDFSHPEFIRASKLIDEMAGIKAGGFHVVSSDHDALKTKIDAGFTFMAYGDDMVFMAEKLGEEAGFVKGLLG